VGKRTVVLHTMFSVNHHRIDKHILLLLWSFLIFVAGLLNCRNQHCLHLSHYKWKFCFLNNYTWKLTSTTTFFSWLNYMLMGFLFILFPYCRDCVNGSKLICWLMNRRIFF
jgi:hypothetical protein